MRLKLTDKQAIALAKLYSGTGRNSILAILKSPKSSIGMDSEIISGLAVLKQGEHYFDSITNAWKGFGWEHISKPKGILQSHANDIKVAFGLPNNESSVRALIKEALEKGQKEGDSILYTVSNSNKQLKVVISEDSLGSIQTAYPIG